MSNDTTAFVTAGKESVMEIIQSVMKEINSMISDKLNSHLNNIETDRVEFFHFYNACKGKHDSNKWTTSAEIMSGDFKNFQITFGYGDGDEKSADKRILWVNTDCSCDYSDTYTGDKIIFSTGSWGGHTDIMTAVLKVLAKFGDTYYRKNDADDFIAIG